MSATLAVTTERWPLERPFRISRGVKREAVVVVATVSDGVHSGRGESVPYPRYGESAQSVVATLDALAGALAGGLDRSELAERAPPGAARNALDCALWDLEAKRAGRPAWDLAGLAKPAPLLTAETIGIDTPAAMGARAAELAAAPLLKIKLDGEAVAERVRAVHEAAPAARLVVDPNEGWTFAALRRHAPVLAALGVEMIEQPLPAGEDDALAGYRSPVMLCADESCHVAADVPALLGRYSMVNVKLDKTGGLSGALELRAAAEAAGMELMVGCMVGTSLAMAPAVLVAQGARIVDLDGPLILAQDRVPGLRYAAGSVYPPPPELWG